MEQTQSQEQQKGGRRSALEPIHFKAAERLKKNQNRIKEIWEKRVREQNPGTEGQTSLVLVNSLGIFLDELAVMLAQASPSLKALSERGMSKIHGGQRATLFQYSLPQLLLEFSILRDVLNEDFDRHGVLTYDVRATTDKAIDLVISEAATEFVSVQNAAIKAALNKSEMSNRDLDHFAAVAAHDLKSPLATISGYLSLLNDEFGERLGEEGLGYIHLMYRASERMRSLIDRLLGYARLTKVDKHFQSIDATNVVKAATQNLADAVAQANAKVIYDRLPIVTGDVDLLTQLFQNLIANGIKFHGDAPPEIDIDARDKDGMFLFSVRDNGIGFDPKYKEDIFALYKKLHSETEYQGTGVGLATCRKVVELHGGTIWADSKPGAGSTFYFTLPKSRRENDTA